MNFFSKTYITKLYLVILFMDQLRIGGERGEEGIRQLMAFRR